ncbi:MAG: exodeoxyribonuclease VII small subunit [Anaerolineae bacterium]
MAKAKPTSFEENYKRLEQVIARLDSGNLPLDESVALYEEGMRLARSCEQQLDNAEIKVTQLLTDAEKTDPGLES